MYATACEVISKYKMSDVFCSSSCQEGAFALVFKSVHYPGEAVGTRYTHTAVRLLVVTADLR